MEAAFSRSAPRHRHGKRGGPRAGMCLALRSGMDVPPPVVQRNSHPAEEVCADSDAAAPAAWNRRASRVLLYSHDSFGLGHLRRTLTLAAELAHSLRDASVLIVSGNPCATQFPLPRGVEVVKLPAVTKDVEGHYAARNLRGGLDLIRRLRAELLRASFETFQPDLLIADHQPIGLDGELLPVLRRARQCGARTILGLRDVIDDPEVVAHQWSHPEIREALAELYDRVCVYGDERIFDQRREYPIPPELARRVEYTGYVVRDGAARRGAVGAITRPQMLVTAGGGEDGESRIQCCLEALALAPTPWDTTVVLGPLMHPLQARRLKRMARSLRNVRPLSFHADMPRLLSEMDVVVAMAGYNTVAEILQARVNSVLLPRVFPRREQLIRAERLEAAGLARCVAEPTPRIVRDAMESALGSQRDWRSAPSMDGAERTCAIALEVLDERAAAQHGALRKARP